MSKRDTIHLDASAFCTNIIEKETAKMKSKHMMWGTIILIVIFVSAVLLGCSTETKKATPAITMEIKNDPAWEAQAGHDFNVGANGVSAMWLNTRNVPKTGVLLINGVEMQTFVRDDGLLVTAYIPKAIYEKAGTYPLYILDPKTGSKSNEVRFIVK
jgi:hypothetical protein